MTKAFIDPDKCIRCDKCYAARVCPVKAIFYISDEDPKVVEPNICHGCGDCTAKCSVEAVILRNG